ncbi:MAG: hypothetical protein KIT31_29140 [Deltaproteobacteria bacterium]|nr:hypothetical protein [Deltaproteobacteria bacterium]
MSIVLMTHNRWKIAEYRRFLARHAQTLLVEAPTESPAVLASWLATARAVLADESNIFDPRGDLVDARYAGPARNICRLHAWVKDGDAVVRTSYLREVAGTFDGAALRPGDATVFDWDVAFTNAAGATLDEMSSAGLKSSAREQCLSAFARAHLHHKAPRTLRWSPALLEAGADWTTDARLLLEHPLYRNLAGPLRNALAFAVDQGIFFRAARSRRDGNYWFPGLNGGLPFVPKSDAVHEGTYMFHDVMHQLMPDLVFDGGTSLDHKRTYIAYRMMSEGVSLVLADMCFVDTLARDPAHAGYDFAKRRIYPLYRELGARRDDLPWLLRQMIGYVTRGARGDLPADTDAWRAFEAKYARFFVADFQWTRMNWANLVSRAAMTRRWIDLVYPETFRAQGVWFVGEVVAELGRDLPLDALCARLFELVWARRIAPALAYTETPDVARARSNGFRRWLTGQLAFFAHYAPIVDPPPLAHELAARVRDPRPFDRAELDAIRARFADHVRALAADGIISDDDAAIFPDLFPLFDPFFLRDYDEAQQEFATVAEASAVALS